MVMSGRLKTLTELLHQVSLQGGLIARTAAENIPNPNLKIFIIYNLANGTGTAATNTQQSAI